MNLTELVAKSNRLNSIRYKIARLEGVHVMTPVTVGGVEVCVNSALYNDICQSLVAHLYAEAEEIEEIFCARGVTPQ